MNKKHRGFARIDLALTLMCMTILIAIASAATAQDHNGRGTTAAFDPKTVKDATLVRSMHQSYLVFAKDNKGHFPAPGLINRLPDLPSPPGVGNQPGVGPEDLEANTTANLHSAMIMQNFYAPDMIISTVERNPHVRADADYNYELYDVVKDVYWDSSFKADLSVEANVSYANLVLCGERKKREWRDTMNAKFATLGNRGPENGAMMPQSLTCGPHGNWAGNIIFNDNHMEFFHATAPEQLVLKNAEDEEKSDNLFAIDDGMNGRDVILSFTKKISKDGAELQWD